MDGNLVQVGAFVKAGDGIGLGFSETNRVADVQSTSPLAGKVLVGDVLVSINGENVQGVSVEEIRKCMWREGGDGQEVKLVVRRASITPVITVDDEKPQQSPQQQRRLRRTGATEQMTKQPPQVLQLRPTIESLGKRHSVSPEVSPREAHNRKMIPMQPSKTIDFGELPQWRKKPVITLQNYCTGEQTVDKLHQGEQVNSLLLCLAAFSMCINV